MSSDLYLTRLLWTGRLGIAKCAGVIVELTRWPVHIWPGLHVAEMDYRPEVRDCRIRESGRAWRAMTGDECRRAAQWLAGMARGVRALIDLPINDHEG